MHLILWFKSAFIAKMIGILSINAYFYELLQTKPTFEMKKLFLLDGMALIYRAYFALSKSPRITSRGLNTSAILGFANTLFDVLKNENPTHIAVSFDTKAPTHRHVDFADYKANREDMPEDLSTSLPYIIKLIEGFRIPVLAIDGYEADDVIGTLAKKAEKKGFKVYMMTPDKDFGQLVTDNIFVYRPARMGNRPEIWGVKEVCERFNIQRPEQVTDILGLWGDASDNIPGIPGIGEKRAKEFISRFGSLEALIENSQELSGKMKENVEKYASQGIQSKALATLHLDAPVEVDEEIMKRKEPDPGILIPLFEELEFRTYAKRVFPHLAETDAKIESGERKRSGTESAGISLFSEKKTLSDLEVRYHLTDSRDKHSKLIDILSKAGEFCFDTETTGLDPHCSELVGVAFSVEPGEAWFVPLPENYQECLSVVQEFSEVFEDPSIRKIGQNLKYDISVLKWYDIEVKGELFDTMLAHYLIQPEMRHNMDVLAETYLGYKPVSIETLIGKKGKGQASMRSVDTAILKDYACEDADITLRLKEVFDPKLDENHARELFQNVEVPLVKVLASMEMEGVKLDKKTLENFSAQLGEEILAIEKSILEMAGADFKVASPRQLGEILFEKLKIDEKPKMTRTKQYSTSEDVLQKLINKHPVVPAILDYRSLTKLKSTYVDVLPTMINRRTGRIHTSFNQTVTATGRLSSNNPNLQNIPVRTEKGREIRKAFIPRNDNYLLFAADYSQIELRIMADLSNDRAMIEDFREGKDIHTATASRVFGVSEGQVTSGMRRNAKTVNFGIIYGISAFGLSERLNIPRSEAGEIIKQYFARYPGIREYMDSTIAFARENGYVKTILGRRRYLRDINSSNNTVRGFAERNAINAPIQGSSADMIKVAMIGIFNEMNERKLKTKMILQVHDELVFDLHKNEEETVREIVSKNMTGAISLKVPLVVDMNTGSNWLEAHS